MALVDARLAQLSAADQQQLADWVAEFERTWDVQQLLAWAEVLPAAENPLRFPALVSLIQADLRQRWQRGDQVQLNVYLKLFEELGVPDTVPVDLILTEYQLRRQYGARASLAQFAERFPNQYDELVSLLAQVAKDEEQAGVKGPHGETYPMRSPQGHTVEQPPPTDEAAEGHHAALPDQLGRYEVRHQLGVGAMGAVYLARDTQLDRLVALKVPKFELEGGKGQLDRFYREARAASTLNHPNICPLYEVGECNGIHYLAMAYIEGQTLAALLKAGQRPSPRMAVNLVRKLALAMEEAHARGVIHRDLKPANIIINQRGEPIIMDFGLARLDVGNEVPITRPGAALGTPAYMPPEQVIGDLRAIGPQSDVYSLGVILYELLTGHRPFRGHVSSLMNQVVKDKPPPFATFRKDLEPRLESLVMKALAKKVKNRYDSMAEFAIVLTGYLRAEDDPIAVSRSVQPQPQAVAPLAGTIVPPPEAPTEDEAPPTAPPPTASEDPMPEPEPAQEPVTTAHWTGETLAGGRYEIVALLEEGTTALLYRARDHNLGNQVVIRVPRAELVTNEEFTRRFAREVRSLVKLAHPHVVRVLDAGLHEGIPYAVLQFLAGGTLAKRFQGLPTAANLAGQLRWLEGIAEALDFIHGQGYLHRDLRPANILFDQHGNSYLSDFGISEVLAGHASEASTQVGTPPYLAPEVSQRLEYDGRADQYALAVTLYELLGGRLPFVGPTAASIVAEQSTGTPTLLHELNPAIPVGVAHAVQRGLARSPRARYGSCAELARAVLAAVGGKVADPAKTERYDCPSCHRTMKFRPAAWGKKVRCPGCQATVDLPPPPASRPSRPAPKHLLHLPPKVPPRGVVAPATPPAPSPTHEPARAPTKRLVPRKTVQAAVPRQPALPTNPRPAPLKVRVGTWLNSTRGRWLLGLLLVLAAALAVAAGWLHDSWRR